MRTRWRVPLALAVIALFVMGGSSGTYAATDRVDFIIAFDHEPGAAETALVRAFGGDVRGVYSIVPAIAASAPSAAIAALRAQPGVARVELDGRVDLVHLGDTDEPAEVTEAWGVDRLDANLVWPLATGSGAGVAIVDTGSGPHPDLPDAVLRVNCLSGSCVAGGNDDHGHGTHVAGSALAQLNGFGVVGVAHGAALFSYKVLNQSGSGSWSGIIAALDHIVAHNASAAAQKVHVANFSLGSSFNPGATVQAAFDATYASGVLVVAAAGNSGNPPGKGDKVIYPARWASVVAVAATDKNDARATFSSTGPDVELAAPGVSVNSTWLGGTYRSASGTSMATPHVSGSAALAIAAKVLTGALVDANGANGTADEVRDLLDATAKDLGAAGRDTHYGYGLVNPEKAVTGANSHY